MAYKNHDLLHSWMVRSRHKHIYVIFADFDSLHHSRLTWTCKSQNTPVFCGQQRQTDRSITLPLVHACRVITSTNYHSCTLKLNIFTDQVYGLSIRLFRGREIRRFELCLRRRVDLHTHILTTDKAAYVCWSWYSIEGLHHLTEVGQGCIVLYINSIIPSMKPW